MDYTEVLRQLSEAGYQPGEDYVLEVEDLPEPELWVTPAVLNWIRTNIPTPVSCMVFGAACGPQGCAIAV